jgi:hypothetical protein
LRNGVFSGLPIGSREQWALLSDTGPSITVAVLL